MRIKVSGGTPDSKVNLCVGCKHSLIVRGHRLSEEKRLCCVPVNHPIKIDFPVAECTDFRKKEEPDLKRMEDIAWIIRTNSSGQAIGFVSSKSFKADNPDDDIVPYEKR